MITASPAAVYEGEGGGGTRTALYRQYRPRSTDRNSRESTLQQSCFRVFEYHFVAPTRVLEGNLLLSQEHRSQRSNFVFPILEQYYPSVLVPRMCMLLSILFSIKKYALQRMLRLPHKPTISGI